MIVALFIPCYIDQFYPQVAVSTIQLLEKVGVTVVYPLEQTCCGQPLANSGFQSFEGGCSNNFINNFIGFDFIVCPSGSCVLHIKEHLVQSGDKAAKRISQTIYELTEFLVDIINVNNLCAYFPYSVGFHTSCHGQRGLGLSSMSEIVGVPFSKPGQLLSMVEGIKIRETERMDECCGFGGTFCIFEEAVSVQMGKDRITEHEMAGVDFITGVDMSCLMHLEGILKRNKSKIKVIHISEILNASNV